MMATALVAAAAGAQGADTVRAAADTVAARVLPQASSDTIKAPLAAFRDPAQFEVDSAYRWNREEIFRLGDLTLDEFLDRIPGATSYRTGWLGTPSLVAYAGDFTRVRVFLDGIEMNAVNPHAGGLLDLTRIKIWTLEEIAVERGADELRVYLTSWRVERTTPGTRTDVLTGDQETNLYRGFFGKRFKHGEALQVGAQQYGYSNGIDAFGGGDELSLFARLGWARRGFSIDAFASRANLTRDAQPQLNGSQSIPFDKSTRTDAYARLGLGNSREGAWLQLIAASQSIAEDPEALQSGDPDSTFSVLQYVAAAGYTRRGLRLSAAGRINDPRTPRADKANTITGRASWQGRYFGAGIHADFRDSDSVSLAEASIQLRPTSWLSASVTGARRDGGPLESPLMSARGELGLRLGGMWLLGGVLASDTTHGLNPPILFDTLFLKAEEPRAPLGFYGGMRGRLYHDLFIDAQLTRWREGGIYRPQYDGRAEAYIDTRWLGRFPSGSFGFRGGVAYLYRDRSFFPATGGVLETPTIMRALRMQLEVRILDGTLFWQQRYMLLPSRPEMVPGYGLPRQTNIYGIRWQFWN